jgi:hypothetical protein
MMNRFSQFALAIILTGALVPAQAQSAGIKSGIRVKRVEPGTVYLDGGKDAGLTAGMTLTIKRAAVFTTSSLDGQVKGNVIVARVLVVSISDTLAVCDIRFKNSEVRPGDLAMVSPREPNKAAANTPVQPTPETSANSGKSVAERAAEYAAKRRLPESAAGVPLKPVAQDKGTTSAAKPSIVQTATENPGQSLPTPVMVSAAKSVEPEKLAEIKSTPPMSDTGAQLSSTSPATTKATETPVTSSDNVARKDAAQQIPAISAVAGKPAVDTSANGTGVTPAIKAAFHVKYVAEDAVYIDAGKNAGLTQGMALTITRANGVVAELGVVSVSNTSAVCEIRTKQSDIQRGDVATLSQLDQDKLVQARTLPANRKYPQVIAFSEGDPLDEEAREIVPKPPLPEVNRARGRIGLDYTLINTSGTASTHSAQIGGVLRIDMTRIAGTYWNLNGSWRGRLNMFSGSSSAQPQSVNDLVNRTYTIGFTYANPNSKWTAGVGRLYLPWATSLDTLDGGYLGRKVSSHVTLGVFGGTAPDPTSFNYNPNRRTAGTFVALEGGSFDGLRFTSAEGLAVSGIGWREDRQFLFSENGLFFKKFISIYHSAQADKQRLPTGGTTQGLARSFATLRVQPFSRFSIDINHNYFRDVPTFDALLVGTGLLDKFLFQGISVGTRLDLPGKISIYDNFGQSSKTGDAKSSFNQLYGVTAGQLWKTGIRADVRYSKFNSTFGQGNYRAVSLSRSLKELGRIEVTAGQQKFMSSLATPTNYKLVGTTVDLNLGGNYFFESGFNLQRGGQQNFQQWTTTMGYRFDTGRRK